MAQPSQFEKADVPDGKDAVVVVDLPTDKTEEKASNGPPPASFSSLFSFADRVDLLLIALGTVGALAAGACLPLFSILFGNFTNLFGGDTGGDFIGRVSKLCLKFLYLGIGAAVASYMEMAFFTLAGNRQANRVRHRYLAATLRQDIAWFDVQATTGGLLQGLNEDSNDLQSAISEKLGTCIHNCSTFLVGYLIAFAYGWDMTLVMLGCVPFLAAIGGLLVKFVGSATQRTNEAYAKASAIAQQSISQIRTVAAYCQETRSMQQYEQQLDAPLKTGILQGFMQGLSFGGIQMVFMGTYAIALVYGSWRVQEGKYDGGQVISVLLAALLGGFSLGQAAPYFAALGKGRSAGARLFLVIARVPPIDILAPDGEEPQGEVQGRLQFLDVHFSYPARSDVPVLKGLNLTVEPGTTCALVGSSGSGKSTVVALLERFYDPLSGSVTLDGIDLRRLKLGWLRQQVGLVSQEPVLFAMTIGENIRLGRPSATDAEVEEAAAAANAHNFISSLPQGYNTHVGERGVQMSGGQKQRIAIARAILKNSKVLLLDEATSALDTHSERIVQEALDRMVVGRTTVVVAHRLSTIQNADVICVVRAGEVVEQGSHAQLLKDPAGVYSNLVKLQMQKKQAEPSPTADSHPDTNPDHVKISPEAYSPPAVLLTSRSSRSSWGHANGSAPAAAAGVAADVSLAHASSVRSTLGDSAKEPQTGKGQGAAGGNVGDLELGLVQMSHALDTAVPPVAQEGVSRTAIVKALGDDTVADSTRLRRCLPCLRRKEKTPTLDKDGKPITPPVKVPFTRLLALNRPELKFIALGLLGCLMAGVQQPIFGFVLAAFINEFYSGDLDRIRSRTSFYCWLFFALGAGGMLGIMLQLSAFAVAGQNLARRIRVKLFGAILRQEVAWFDKEENNSGTLTSGLAADAAYVRGAVGDVMGLTIQNITTLGTGYFIAFYFDWRMALLVTGALPFVATAGYINMKFMTGYSAGADKLYAAANQSVTEAFSSVRVIHAYSLQEAISRIYLAMQASAVQTVYRQAHIAGIAFAFSNFTMFTLYSLILYFGAQEISHGWTTFGDMFKAFLAILIAAMGMSQATVGFPDIGKAAAAVQRIFPIIDRVPIIDSQDPNGQVIAAEAVRGEIALESVSFVYPNRTEVTIFKDFNLSVPAGKSLAMVGESGSGKSTVVGLVLRFYDVNAGRVTLDGIDVRQLNVRFLRSQVGLVAQEPLLFSGTIIDNIRYGRPNASMEEVQEAAVAANAWDFVSALPDGLNTIVGENGIQLSGGQKQRVAIARAVIKNPRILLLDEATSALDSQSEKIVQSALDRVMVGRTTIVVAHRLSTIRNVDAIAVLFRGKILEQGSHDQLSAIPGGHYARLVEAQARGNGGGAA